VLDHLLLTLQNILLPVFLQIGLGFLLKKLIRFKVDGLVNVQFYLVIPSLLFVSMYNMAASNSIFGQIILHALALVAILYLLSLLTARLLKVTQSKKSAMVNNVCLYNSGNFGIPLVQLLYGTNPLAMSVQMIIMMVSAIMTNTLGIYSANRGNKNFAKAIFDIFKVPMVYSVLLAFLLRGLQVPVWPPVWKALESLGQALVPIALITLGAQLAETRLTWKWLDLLPTIFLRLVVSPLIAFLLVRVLGLQGVAAQVAIIAAASPTAINAVLLAIKYDNEPAFASEVVFLSTVLSALTVALTINLVGYL
jgi:malate permease and related proteins